MPSREASPRESPSSEHVPANLVTRTMRVNTSLSEDVANEESPLIPAARKLPPLNYNSDSAVNYGAKAGMSPSTRRHVYYGGGHYNATNNSSSDEEGDQDMFAITIPPKYQSSAPIVMPHAKAKSSFNNFLKPNPVQHTRYLSHFDGNLSPQQVIEATRNANRYTRRSRMRNMKKFRQDLSIPKMRVSAYCTCDSLHLFKLLKWLERIETGQLPGGELSPNGWTHKMYMGAIHSSCATEDREDDIVTEDSLSVERKDVFYFATGCTVFWGLTRAEEQAHIQAIRAFSKGYVKQVEVEDMDFCYGESTSVVNDSITLSSFRASEKIAISFAMAQSSKLDVFEQRVDETIQETRHIPQTLAETGEIKKYSQKDISQLIGRLFIERSDINLNSDMLDDPDFFWDDDEYQPLYKKMMKYLDVDSRVHILNTRLDILRELLDVLSQQLARQHDTKLEWIVIWLIVAEVVVDVFWQILIKDILGFFQHKG
ncbi:hypothetical protein THRCLA_06550 [Thraustotheca clavata]|uniref:DUF155 domain-containing protein n=1 Tax=Thraustotheca clavata TaxID=74557 RepID=A0A1V9ZMX3_9STRA|nr:hypothetical protein THRCLA_06550 [Thraustotheca clavata]